MEKIDKKKQGKKSRAAGGRFELKVRKDLESKGWIVSKWMNNVEFLNDKSFTGTDKEFLEKYGNRIETDFKTNTIGFTREGISALEKDFLKKSGFKLLGDSPIMGAAIFGRLIPAKHKFRGPGIPMAIGTGFPDFIAFRAMHINFKLNKHTKELIEKFNQLLSDNSKNSMFYEIIGVESKMN